MLNETVLRDLNIDPEKIEEEVSLVLKDHSEEELQKLYEDSIRNFEPGTILTGRIVGIHDNEVLVDVGYKSEGVVRVTEFSENDPPEVGKTVEVLLEAADDGTGQIVISKRKADRIRGWERIISEHKEGDVVTGVVMRKIKGGLLVDIGVPVFLPASQVDLRRPADIADYIGMEIQAKILKIDEERRNIVISRRQLLEERREEQKKKLLEELKVGDLRKGVVKNIADFGAFIDLGGIDGLLHITDMSWGRVSHPSEVVAIGDEIEVVVISIDHEREKVGLGLKQKTPSPWENIEEKYPVGSRVKGKVVNIVPYGAFVQLEEGVEGLVHISEMSWTRRIHQPSDVVAIGDIVEVVVLGINKEKEEISLGMKQVEPNPWEVAAEKYPPGAVVTGRVRNIVSYGAFVEIEEGIEGLLHVSDMSWTRRVNHPSEMLKKGDEIEVVILNVDPSRRRIALGLKQLREDPWEREIPEKYPVGSIVHGKVTKLASFGAFVELEPELEGLLHVSELSDEKVDNPAQVVSVGDELDLKIIKLDVDNRKIGLSLRQAKEDLYYREEEPYPTDVSEFSTSSDSTSSPGTRRLGEAVGFTSAVEGEQATEEESSESEGGQEASDE